MTFMTMQIIVALYAIHYYCCAVSVGLLLVHRNRSITLLVLVNWNIIVRQNGMTDLYVML